MATPQAADDHLIDRLCAELTPVRRTRSPLAYAGIWLVFVVISALALAPFADLGTMARRLAAAPEMWLAVVGSTLTAVLAAIAVLQLSLPDRRPAWVWLPMPATALWVGASGVGCLRGLVVPEAHAADWAEARLCLAFIIGFSLPLSLLLWRLTACGFPLRPRRTTALTGLASAAAAATLLSLFHPFDLAALDLLVHVAAVALVIAANASASGRRFVTGMA